MIDSDSNITSPTPDTSKQKDKKIEINSSVFGILEIYIGYEIISFFGDGFEDNLDEAINYAGKIVNLNNLPEDQNEKQNQTEIRKKRFSEIVSSYLMERKFIREYQGSPHYEGYLETDFQLQEKIERGSFVRIESNEDIGFVIDEASIGDAYDLDLEDNPEKRVKMEELILQRGHTIEDLKSLRANYLFVPKELIGLISFLSTEYRNKLRQNGLEPINLNITSLTRTKEYQELVQIKYSGTASDSLTNHATGHAFDIGLNSTFGGKDRIYRTIFDELIEEIFTNKNKYIFYLESGCYHISMGPEAVSEMIEKYNELYNIPSLEMN